MKSNKNVHAVLALDPGGTTGVGAGYAELEGTRRTTVEAMFNRKTAEVKGNYLEQAAKLATIMNKFVFTANVENGIPLPNIHIVIENFVLRRREAGGATGNLTSCWVAAGAVAIYCTEQLTIDKAFPKLRAIKSEDMISWQNASDAKHVANDERLKSYGLWVVGSAHERDANRHLVLKFDKLIG